MSGGEAVRRAGIRAVLFDLDGTLYSPVPLRIAMASEMAVVSGLRAFSGGLGVPRIVSTFRATRERLRDELDGAPPIVERQYSAAAEDLGLSTEIVEQTVDEWMYRRPLKWLPYCRRRDLLGLLDWLERHGLGKGILSDYPAHDKLAALGVAGRFDPVVTALDGDVNAFKPSPRGYLEAARRWGLDPSEVLYVGDRADVDAAGALAAGMPAAVLTSRRLDPGVIGTTRLGELERVLDPGR